uniref:WAP domain-containing protein n=1 Tax=Rhabditophanes sp. KR3021 TaxID=114890 RepID=A0AC35U3W4_9BILA
MFNMSSFYFINFIFLEFLNIYLVFGYGYLPPSNNNNNNGPANFVPYIPNNNIALGYPTAYGLGHGYIKSGGNSKGGNLAQSGGGSSATNAFPIRCSNGGAHIGSCRLDDDAICKALGGICINSACCTIPFFADRDKTTTPKPNMIDLEILNKRTKQPIEYESDEGDLESDEIEAEEEVEEEVVQKPKISLKRSGGKAKLKLLELQELSKLIETSKVQNSTTLLPNEITSTTLEPSITTSNYTVNAFTKVCSTGLKPIGPCNEDLSCPTSYSCEASFICCFQF